MREIEHILDQKPIGGQCCDEEFVDPLTHTFAYWNVLPWGRSGMASHHPAHVRQALPQFQPPSSNSSTTSPVFILLTLAVGG